MASPLTSRQGCNLRERSHFSWGLGHRKLFQILGRKAAMPLFSALRNYLVYLFCYWPGLVPGAGKYWHIKCSHPGLSGSGQCEGCPLSKKDSVRFDSHCVVCLEAATPQFSISSDVTVRWEMLTKGKFRTWKAMVHPSFINRKETGHKNLVNCFEVLETEISFCRETFQCVFWKILGEN